MSVSLPRLGKFPAVMSSVFCGPFLSFSFWDSYNVNVSAFDVVLEVS